MCRPCIRSGVSKYLVQWDKDNTFGRSQTGGEVSHADAAQWSEVVADTQHQVQLCMQRLRQTNYEEWHNNN